MVIDPIGKTFDKLTVISRVDSKDNKNIFYHCTCSCGGDRTLSRSDLFRKGIRQCAACANETRKQKQTTVNAKENRLTYNSYRSILLRCSEHIRYMNVPICEEWLCEENGFHNFMRDMGPRPTKGHTIDRIKNSEGYYKENCRWATVSVQNHNKSKRRDSIHSTFIGVTLSKSKWHVQFMKEGMKISERFNSEEDAATYYDNLSEIYYGDRPNNTEKRDVKPLMRKMVSCNAVKYNKYRVRVFDWSGKRVTIGHFFKEEAEEITELLRYMYTEDKYEMCE